MCLQIIYYYRIILADKNQKELSRPIVPNSSRSAITTSQFTGDLNKISKNCNAVKQWRESLKNCPNLYNEYKEKEKIRSRSRRKQDRITNRDRRNDQSIKVCQVSNSRSREQRFRREVVLLKKQLASQKQLTEKWKKNITD